VLQGVVGTLSTESEDRGTLRLSSPPSPPPLLPRRPEESPGIVFIRKRNAGRRNRQNQGIHRCPPLFFFSFFGENQNSMSVTLGVICTTRLSSLNLNGRSYTVTVPLSLFFPPPMRTEKTTTKRTEFLSSPPSPFFSLNNFGNRRPVPNRKFHEDMGFPPSPLFRVQEQPTPSLRLCSPPLLLPPFFLEQGRNSRNTLRTTRPPSPFFGLGTTRKLPGKSPVRYICPLEFWGLPPFFSFFL